MPLVKDVFDIDAIQQQLQAYQGILAQAKKAYQDLFEFQKSFKDTSITNLSENTQQLSVVIGQAAGSTQKAVQANQQLAESIKAVVTAGTGLGQTYTAANASLDENIKTQIRYRAEANNLKDAQKLLQAQIAAVGQATDSQAAKQVELVKALTSVSQASKDMQRTISNQIKEQTSASGSIDQMKASLAGLTQTYDKLGASAQGSEGGKELQKSIQQINAALTELEVKTGRSQRKVGDYTGAVATLEEQLKLVNTQLTQMAARQGGPNVQNLGAVGFKQGGQREGPSMLAGGTGIGFDPARYKQLQQEAEALTVVIGRQEKGFTSVTQQIRASEQALATLAAAGLEGSQGFEKLRESTVSAAQAQKEFIRQERLLESEAPALGAIALAAKGLAGAYAVGAGAQALFADGNEKVEKELNKLVAIMTILQGLQEAYQFINKAGAATLAIKNALTKTANGLMKENVAETEALAGANAQAAAAQEAATAATGEEAIALQAEADAALEAAAAMQAAATSAAATNTAIAASVIGVVILAVAAAAAYLIYKMKEWNAETELTIEEQTALVNAMKEYEAALKEVSKLEGDRPENRAALAAMEKQLSLEEKSGQNQYKLFAIKDQIAKKNKEIADQELSQQVASAEDRYGGQLIGIQALRQAQKDYFEDYTNASYKAEVTAKSFASFQELTDQQREHGDTKRRMESAKILLDLANAEKERAKARYENAYEADKNADDADKAFQELQVERAKFTADEIRRVTLELANFEIDLAKDKNQRVLSDEASSYGQRVEALKAIHDLEIQQAAAERASLDPHATEAETRAANQKNLDARVKANRELQDRLRDEDRKEIKKTLDARLEIYRDANQVSQQYEEDTLSRKIGPGENEVTADQKLQALAAQLQERRNLIEQNRRNDLHELGLTNEQRLAINKKYDAQLEMLDIAHLKDQRALNKEIKDAILAEWDLYYENRKTQLDKESDLEIDALNKRLEAGKISRRKYADEARKIEEKKAQDSIDLQVNKDYIHVSSTKDGTKDRADAENQLQDDLAKQSATRKNNFIADQDADLKKVQDTSEKIAAVSGNASNAVAAAWNIGFRTQQVDLENLEKRQERAFTVEQKQIEDTSANQQQKSLRLKILDDQKAAQDTKNARKQRQLDIEKAKFDRDKSIFDIIIGGEVAVVKALPNIPLAISVGILAAAELAAAIATPLPKYRRGTKSHPGGPAVVGDAYQAELILEPGEDPYMSPAVPTVLDLAPRSKVIPADEIERMIGSGMFVNERGVIQQADRGRDIQQLKEAIVWQTGRIERALAKNKPRIVNNIKLDAKFGEHIHKSVFK
jgi:hypothetical protein